MPQIALYVADSLLKVLAGFALGFTVRDITARKGVRLHLTRMQKFVWSANSHMDIDLEQLEQNTRT